MGNDGQTMEVRVILVLLVLCATGFGSEFSLVKLRNAKCIDGSPAAYYIARNRSSASWVVWLEGGGICQSLSDCQQRSKTDLGSSKGYPASIDAPKGMLESNSE